MGKMNMKNRTIGRASQYMSPAKQPRAGAQSSTPSRRPKLKDVSLQQQREEPQARVTPLKTRKEISTAATSSVKQSPSKQVIPEPTNEQLEGFQSQYKEDVVKELLGWKQL